MKQYNGIESILQPPCAPYAQGSLEAKNIFFEGIPMQQFALKVLDRIGIYSVPRIISVEYIPSVLQQPQDNTLQGK